MAATMKLDGQTQVPGKCRYWRECLSEDDRWDTDVKPLARLSKDDRTKDIPVIHLSAVGDFDKQLQAMQEGSKDYITKPIRPAELADRVEAFLDPSKKQAADRETHAKTGRLRAITDIMHRDSQS